MLLGTLTARAPRTTSLNAASQFCLVDYDLSDDLLHNVVVSTKDLTKDLSTDDLHLEVKIQLRDHARSTWNLAVTLFNY